MSRGRLIRPLYVDLQVLDKAASAGARDDDFREHDITRPFGERGGVTSTGRVSGLVYQDAVRVKAQVEVTNINRRSGSQAGNVPDYRTAFVAHYAELETLGLVDATTGKPILEGAKVVGMYRLTNGAVERLFDDPPVHVVELRDVGIGLGGRRNLLMMVTDDRPQGLEETK